jgi:hypothetical protein
MIRWFRELYCNFVVMVPQRYDAVAPWSCVVVLHWFQGDVLQL